MTKVDYDQSNLPSDFRDRGFPFDDSEVDDFSSRLQDIAQRHPEFAEHLNPGNWGGQPAVSHSGPSEDPFTRLRRSRFPRFSEFPFEEFPDSHQFERYYTNPQETVASSPQASSSQQERPPPQAQHLQEEQNPPNHTKEPELLELPATSANYQSLIAIQQSPAESQKSAYIQQSSTVDLGQPQESLVDETRTQRSMSAPPDHRNAPTAKRFVSSINIPHVNADMGGGMSQQPSTDHGVSGSNPKERIIPIHIEGRDEPVIPKASHTQQPEMIFGQRPSTFTQFVHQQPGAYEQEQITTEELRQQAEARRQQQQQKYQEFQKQQQEQQQQQQQQQHPQQQQQEQIPQPPCKSTSLDLIQNIQKGVSELMTQVEQFNGKPRDKEYLYLDEMLTRKMLQLDDIETGGQDAIRKARKEAIKCIQDTLKILETKAIANEEAAKSSNYMKEADTRVVSDTVKEDAPVTSTVEIIDVDAYIPDAEKSVQSDTVPLDSTIKEVAAQNDQVKTSEVEQIEQVIDAVAPSNSPGDGYVDTKMASVHGHAEELKDGASDKKKVKKKGDKK